MALTFGNNTYRAKTYGSNSFNVPITGYTNLDLVLDDATRAVYLAQPNAQLRAAQVVAAINTTVYLRVYDGLGVKRAEGRFLNPWGVSDAQGRITVGEVDVAGVTVSNGGVPNEYWYVRIEGVGNKFVQGGFGVQGNLVNFLWQDPDFTTGQSFKVGDIQFTCLP